MRPCLGRDSRCHGPTGRTRAGIASPASPRNSAEILRFASGLDGRPVETVIADASRALVLGIGGGGDVVGALSAGRFCEALGTEFVLGGVAWERFAIDPKPGPRSIDEIVGGRRLGSSTVLAGPETGTADGLRFCESKMAAHFGAATVLVDVNGGPATIADGVVAAAGELGCDLLIWLDVGGDAIAAGGEPGLASPLCDALMLAAAARTGVAGLGAVFGAGCDAELSPAEVLARIAVLAQAGAWLGSSGMAPAVADELIAAATAVPTEASLQAAHCAKGVTGEAPIRGGRRTVSMGPVGAITFYFDPLAGPECLPLAHAVADAADLEAAREALAALGIRTELDYERDRAAGS